MILTEIGFQSEAGPIVTLIETTCWYCGSDRHTTVIPQEWSGARKLIVCSRCGEVTELGCWPDRDVMNETTNKGDPYGNR